MIERLEGLIQNRQVLFAGIGNVLKKDDGVGVHICKGLQEKPHRKVLIVESAIEKFIGKINDIQPDTLILVDCMFFPAREPGYFDLLPVGAITRFSLHTHNISLGNLADFFTMPVFILGIHPQDLSFGENLTDPVNTAAGKIVSGINSIR